jgi:hypothetical protein
MEQLLLALMTLLPLFGTLLARLMVGTILVRRSVLFRVRPFSSVARCFSASESLSLELLLLLALCSRHFGKSLLLNQSWPVPDTVTHSVCSCTAVLTGVLPFSLSGTIGFKLLLNADTGGPNGCILGRLLLCSDAILTAYRHRWPLALILHRRLAWIRTVLAVPWISSWRLKSVVVGRPSQGTQSSFSSTLLHVLMLCVLWASLLLLH